MTRGSNDSVPTGSEYLNGAPVPAATSVTQGDQLITVPRQGAICALSSYTVLPALAHVKIDQQSMTEALSLTGFVLQSEHILPAAATGNDIITWLTGVFMSAPPDAIYLLHFCGHGFRLQMDSILCVETFNPKEPSTHSGSVILQANLKLFIGNRMSRPRFVIMSFDACNEYLQANSFFLGSVAVTNGGPPKNKAPILVIHGADVGQICRAVPRFGGHFSRAFAEAVHPKSWPQNVNDAIVYAEEKVKEYCVASNHPQQEVKCYPEPLDRELMKLPVFKHCNLNSKGAQADAPRSDDGQCDDAASGEPSPQIHSRQASQTTATEPRNDGTRPRAPAEPDFPFLEIVAKDGTVVRLAQPTTEMATKDERALIVTTQERIRRMRDILNSNSRPPA